MNEIRSLAEAANDGFNGCSSDELRAYCRELLIPAKANSTDAWMIGKLNDAIAVGAHTGTIETAVKAPQNIRGRELNLKPVGRWEGRRRRVRLHESEQDQKSSWKEIAWDQSKILVHTGMEVPIPYPHYEVLKNAIHVHIRRVEDLVNRRIVESEKRVLSIPFDDLGDDPETAHLPCSWIERQQQDARAKRYYQGTKRNILTRLFLDMVDGSVPRETIREWSDEEVREQVLNKLGLYEECMASEYFLDNAA
jgi:hypothetical protein